MAQRLTPRSTTEREHGGNRSQIGGPPPSLADPAVQENPRRAALSHSKENGEMKRADTQDANVITGRDGGVDYVARAELLDPSSVTHTEGHTYRVIELVGTSEKSIEEAINSAIDRAHQTIRHLRWFEVARTSGHIDDGKVSHFQVTLKVGFTMEGAL
jgi:flavin-binding protein dodecin